MKQTFVFNLLSASAPYTDYADRLMLYGQFVGARKMEAIWHSPDGSAKKGGGEWHFAWILGGRGIQDVLFADGAPSHKYGTTLRCYDPSIDAWHITWMQPYGGEYVHLIGRKVGDRIVQESQGTDPQQRERWSFTEITPHSFLWLGEVSRDGGANWFLEQEMRGKRISV